MRHDIEMPHTAGQVPSSLIDYEHIRAMAVIERRNAIAAFPGVVRRWMKPSFKGCSRLFRHFVRLPAP
jgi:hypothetical protein